MDWTVIVGPAAGILIVIIDRWLQRRKASAEASKTLAEADLVRLERKIKESDFWQELCKDIEGEYSKLKDSQEELRLKVNAMDRELSYMKHVLAKMWTGLNMLLRQLAENHLPPAWEPDIEMVRYCTALLEDDRNA